MSRTAPAEPGSRGAVRWLGGAVLVAVLAGAVVVARPDLAPLTAGVVLLVVGFAVMAPCSIQMALVLSTVVRRRAERVPARGLRVAAGRFALGYVTFYLPVALVLGGLARLLGSWAWVAVGIGAVVSLVLGLASLGHPVLDRLGLGALSRCRGPLWLLRTGRASFQRPFRAGLAFGRYCATCCGPYVLAVAVLAGGTRQFAVGAGLVVAYAVLMALPFLAPAVVSPRVYTDLGAAADRIAPRVNRITGFALVGVAIALVPAVVAGALA
jgi:cytochrome c biogenesis protein CcdA